MKLNADLGRRAVAFGDAIDWVASPAPGVHRRMLERDGDEVARCTTIVRFEAGGAFAKRGGATGGAKVPGFQHLERWERAAHRAEGARQIQDANPGHDTPDTRARPTAVDRRADTIPHRMAQLLRLLPDPACAHQPGSVDSPKTTRVSLAAMAERAQPLQGTAPQRRTEVQCSGRRRFADGVLANVRSPGGSNGIAQPLFRLTRSPPTPCPCSSLTRSNRRGT